MYLLEYRTWYRKGTRFFFGISNKNKPPAKLVVMIGDSSNDLSMMKIAGTSVAMGNATEEIKKIATHITSSNDEEGVAKAINQYIV